MEPLEDLPAGWQVWNEDPGGRIVLAYRADVFDGDAFPPSCLPTLTVAPGRSPDGRPDPLGETGRWHVALYLEPDVRLRDVEAQFDDRDAAVEAAVGVARRFANGDLDPRSAYHEPRDDYLERLDSLLSLDEET